MRASQDLRTIEQDLVNKVKGIKGLNMAILNRTLQMLRRPEEADEERAPEGNVDVVAIGASTGGPSALQLILKELPGDFPQGVIISQHMPRGFTRSFSQRLAELSAIRVKEAEDGDEIEGGRALICPGGYHMTLRKKGRKVRVALKKSASDDKYIPSVDAMMASAAENFGARTMGLILTGMGNDGTEGLMRIKSAGGYTVAESEETSVVFGMPASAIRAGAALRVLPLQEMAGEIIRVAGGAQETDKKKEDTGK
jgi:two-component system chemotaxis response regulator CheB